MAQGQVSQNLLHLYNFVIIFGGLLLLVTDDCGNDCCSFCNSGKWPQAVRANGHLLLNSEKVIYLIIQIQSVKLMF